jgi:hypothetical protein
VKGPIDPETVPVALTGMFVNTLLKFALPPLLAEPETTLNACSLKEVFFVHPIGGVVIRNNVDVPETISGIS